MRSVAGLLFAAALLADDWTVFRSGPFEVVTNNDRKRAREVLNHLEQFRHVYGQTLNTGKELTLLWPLRITVGAKTTTDLTLGQDMYVASITKSGAVPRQWNRALAVAFLEESVPRMPAPIEKGLVDFFTTLQVEETRVMGGTPPENPDRDWARIHLLMTADEYYGRVRSLFYNLQQGVAPEPAYKNSLQKTAGDLEKEVDGWFAKRQWAAARMNAKPINLERDFSPRAFDPAKPVPGAGAMAAFDAGDFDRALQLKPDWPAAKFRAAQKKTDSSEKLKLLEEAAVGARRESSYWKALAQEQIAQQKFAEAARSWGAAERAAADDKARAEIRQARAAIEEQRVEYEISEKQRKKEAAEAELNRLKNDALANIRRAEAKANAELGGRDENAAKPVPWWDDPKADGKVSGMLERVDCAAGRMTLAVRDAQKKLSLIALPADPSKLRLQGSAEATFTCGPQRPAKNVTVQYFALKPARPGVLGEAASVIFSTGQ